MSLKNETDSCIRLVLASPDCPHLDSTAALLYKQWPQGGSVNDYLERITSHSEELPCSYILQRHDESKGTTSVGHVRITECMDEASGRAVAATYIITEPRGHGYGRQLMQLLDDRVISFGYHYIYVWTHTAVEFYIKCGFKETKRVSLCRPCLKRLETFRCLNLCWRVGRAIYIVMARVLIRHPSFLNTSQRRRCYFHLGQTRS